MDTYIIGTVKDIFYRTDNGFMVGIFKIKETNDENLKEYKNKTITFSGNFYDIKEDSDYKFYGTIVNHPKYGFQYKVNFNEKLLPEETNSVVSFLSSGMFPGIGEKTAIKIVEKLGDKALEHILDDYKCLLLVPLKESKAKKIYDILYKEQMSYKTIINLQDMGFSTNESIKIYEKYKETTNMILEEDIYSIVKDINYIGFKTVDEIAISSGMQSDDKRRINSAIIYVLKEYCYEEGSTYLYFEELYYNTLKVLNINIEEDVFDSFLIELNKNKEIIIIDNKYLLRETYINEIYIKDKLINLSKIKTRSIKSLESCLNALEKETGIKYNELQKEAILVSIKNNLTIITGGPGTGKTTIINGILNLYRESNKLSFNGLVDEVTLLAPTGRAARRMMESTNFKAVTIHKFLKWDKEKDTFELNENNRSKTKMVIVDESSMIDEQLFCSLLKALSDDVKLILVGDYNQLPSVAPGQVLKDIIDSEKITTIKLNELYRQSSDSYIAVLANNINNSTFDDEFKTKKDDYNFIEVPNYSITEVVCKLSKMALEKGYDYSKIQILCPMYKGFNGIDNLNKRLQEIFNPQTGIKDEFMFGDTLFREGDKVLLTKNINDLDVTNGDIGIIDSITKTKDGILSVINFDGIIVEFTKKNFEDLRLGYAISIHKSQGSEFDIVIMPIDMSFKRMLYKKLIYTGITRAKKSLTIVGDTNAFKYAIGNDTFESRKTLLYELLKNN